MHQRSHRSHGPRAYAGPARPRTLRHRPRPRESRRLPPHRPPLRDAGLNATVVRPWYVLGPGRQWPVILKPIYALLESIPSTHDSAIRLGLVTIEQMTATLTSAVENPPTGVRILETAAIRSGSAL